MVTEEVVACPVPDRATVCMFVASVSLNVTDPVRDPAAVGENVTLMVQLKPPESEVPQSFVSEKSPLARMPAKVIGELLVLVRVRFFVELFVNTGKLPKLKLAGVM